MALDRTNCLDVQGTAKKTRKFAAVKRLLNPKDSRLFVFCPLPLSTGLIICPRKENQLKQKKKDEEAKDMAVRRVCVLFHAIRSNLTSDRTNVWTTQAPNCFVNVPATQYSIGAAVSGAN